MRIVLITTLSHLSLVLGSIGQFFTNLETDVVAFALGGDTLHDFG